MLFVLFFNFRGFIYYVMVFFIEVYVEFEVFNDLKYVLYIEGYGIMFIMVNILLFK